MATTINHTQFDSNARAYLLSLQAGHKPAVRPEFGPVWEGWVQQAEHLYERAGGHPEGLRKAFAAWGKQTPGFEDMLQEVPIQETPARVGEDGVPELYSSRLAPELSRGACPVLDAYVAYSRRASPEAYDDFHAFCGLWMFSVVDARRSYLELSGHRFYGNLMMVLCARTTLVAKTETANVAKRLLVAAGLGHLLLGDRISPQKLMSDMAGAMVPTNFSELPPEKQERAVRKLAQPGQRGWHYDEFGKFVQAMLRRGSTMADFAELFLRLDSCPEEYENSTLARGSEPIDKPYLSLLGTMTPANIRDSAKRGGEFWGDGFWARFSFVCPPPDFFVTQTWGKDPLPIPEQVKYALQLWNVRLQVPDCIVTPIYGKNDELTGRYTIERGALIEHQLTIDDDAHAAYDRYRTELRAMTAVQGRKNQDLDGSYGRLPETAMRMAVLMASLEGSYTISLKHWAKAQELAEILRRNLHRLYEQVNTATQYESTASLLEDDILKTLGRHGALTVNTLRGSYLKSRSSKEIEDCLKGMIRAGSVIEFKTSHAKKYKLATEEEGSEDE